MQRPYPIWAHPLHGSSWVLNKHCIVLTKYSDQLLSTGAHTLTSPKHSSLTNNLLPSRVIFNMGLSHLFCKFTIMRPICLRKYSELPKDDWKCLYSLQEITVYLLHVGLISGRYFHINFEVFYLFRLFMAIPITWLFCSVAHISYPVVPFENCSLWW